MRQLPQQSKSLIVVVASLSLFLLVLPLMIIHNMYVFTQLPQKIQGQWPLYFSLQCFAQNGLGCISIQAHICRVAGQIFVVGLGADHCRIVTAQT